MRRLIRGQSEYQHRATVWRVDIDPDQTLQDLLALSKELDALPADSPARLELEDQRDVLREQARLAANKARDPDNLRAELDHLLSRLETFEADKVEVPDWQMTMTRGGKLSLVDPVADAGRINDAIDAGTAEERAAIEARIADLRNALGD